MRALVGCMLIGVGCLAWFALHSAPARSLGPMAAGTLGQAARPQAPPRAVASHPPVSNAAPSSGDDARAQLAELVSAEVSFNRRPLDQQSSRVAEHRRRAAEPFARRLGARLISAECRSGLCRAELVLERGPCASRPPRQLRATAESNLFGFCEAGEWHTVAFFPDSQGTTSEGSSP